MKEYTGFEIAVIGLSGKFPKANSVSEFWQNLVNAKDCITDFSKEEALQEGESRQLLEDPSYVRSNSFVEDKMNFDAEFFGYLPDEAELMDPQIRLFHECCWEALEDSGYSQKEYAEKVGVFATGSPNVNWELYAFQKNREGLVDDFSASHLRNITFLSSKISYKLNLTGPAVFLQTACSSSLAVIHEACNSLLLGECSMALAGGVRIKNYARKGYLYRKGLINSQDGRCRPFDAQSSGTIGGEGVGVVVLKRLQDAIEDKDHIYAIIKGTAMNNDGSNKVGYTAPSVHGQVEVIKKAHKMAEVAPESITYIETHGTGTQLGDPIEVQALTEAFGESDTKYCAIGSVKSNIGHLDSAAGVAGFIKTVLSLYHRKIPASLHFTQPNPRIDFKTGPFFVNNHLRHWDAPSRPLRAGVSSFGIGGTNVHLVLEESPELSVDPGSRPHHLLVYSANSQKALERVRDRLANHLETQPDTDLSNMAFTLQKGRVKLSCREAFAFSSREEAIHLLHSRKKEQGIWADIHEDLASTIFMFSGQGSQYVNMCKDLYQSERRFQKILDHSFEIASRYSQTDFKDILFSALAPERINETQNTQPILFMVEYALASLFIEWGLQPDYLIGHSIGEFTAAAVSGVLSLQDALKLVIKRGQLMGQVEKGLMLSVESNLENIKPFLNNREEIDVAVINSPNSLVLSGKVLAIENLQEELAANHIVAKVLHTSHAFHSRMMDSILVKFETEVASIQINPPQIPYISSLTASWVDLKTLQDPKYWSRQLRETVRFHEGIQELLNLGKGIFIEVGPGKVLCNHVLRNEEAVKGHFVINTLRHPKQQVNDQKHLLDRLGQLWAQGLYIDWNKFYVNEERGRISLPSYPFEKVQYTTHIDSKIYLKDPSGSSQEEARKPFDVHTYIKRQGWQLSPPLQTYPTQRKDAHAFVLFADAYGVTDSLMSEFKSAGQSVMTVTTGKSFKQLSDDIYQIRRTSQEDLAMLWEDLEKRAISSLQIIYCPTLTQNLGEIEYETLDQHFERGYLGIARIFKSLAGKNAFTEVEVLVVTNNLVAIASLDSVNPLKAAMLGPVKVGPTEMTQVRSRIIDIPFPFQSEKEQETYVKKLLQEVHHHSDLPVVGYRFKERWIPSHVPLKAEARRESHVTIQEEAAYVVTGGLGGMGLTIAKSLVSKFNADVVLLHRSPFPKREEWDNWVRNKDANDPISKKIHQIREVEKQGAKLKLFQVDISKEEEVKGFMESLKAMDKEVKGLIWAAGEVDYGGIIQNRNEDELVKYTQSKIHGLLLFEKYLGFENLEFVALFSSIGNLFYQMKFGQVAYNAANEFLASFAHYGREKYGIHIFTINWTDWLDVGMTVNTQLAVLGSTDISLANSKIPDGLYPHQGVEIFYTCLETDVAVVSTFKKDIFEAIEDQKERRSEYLDVSDRTQGKAESAILDESEESLSSILIATYAKFFGNDSVGLTSDFFELGGDSLKALTLASRINKKLGSKLSIGDIYKYPTPRALSEILKEVFPQQKAGDIPRAQDAPHYPLTPAQRRIYFIQRLNPESTLYNEVLPFYLFGDLDRTQLSKVFKALLERHESLRTSFHMVGEEPVQRISPEVDFELEWMERGDASEEGLIEAFVQPFKLEEPPLIRVAVVKLAPQKHLVITDSHHIIKDGISSVVFSEEFMKLWSGEALPELSIQYKDYAVWQQTDNQLAKLEEQKEFWVEEFAEELHYLDLPTDYTRSSERNFEGGNLEFRLDKEKTANIKELALTSNASVFMVLLSAYYVLLNKLSHQEDLVIGVPTSGRQHTDLEGLIGMFVNTLPMRISCDPDMRFEDFLASVKEKVLACFENQTFPYDSLMEYLNLPRNLARNPLFDVMFNYVGFEKPVLETENIKIQPYKWNSQASRFDLTIWAREMEEGLEFTFSYAKELFNQDTIRRYAYYFQEIIEQIGSNSTQSIREISILSAAERHQLLYGFNDTAVSYPKTETLVSMFETQVARTPSNVALRLGEQVMSYQELHTLSNRIAAYLINEKGVEVGDLVGVMLEREEWLIPVIFGILKAGGAYVPIDPHSPLTRKKDLTTHANLKSLFSRGIYREENSFVGEGDIDLDLMEGDLREYPENEVPVSVNGGDLAYVIHTSGSTGKPKGVMIEHHSVLNRILWMQKTYSLKETDVILQKTPIVFDVSVWELFWWSFVGGSLALLEPEGEKDPQTIINAVSEYQVSTLHFVPSMLSAFLTRLGTEANYTKLKSLDRVFSSGESLKIDQVNSFRKTLYHKCGSNLINFYGPTEATVDVSYFYCNLEKDVTIVPIGAPIDNTRLYILRENGELCPIGVSGELVIAGAGLARGYLGNKSLTDKKFIEHPLLPGERIYKTGDQAKWLSDGNIAFLGRNDNQVKIRGYRIELGEIESQLIQHPTVTNVAIGVKGSGADSFLVAFYTAEKELSTKELRGFVQDRLPAYMVPSFFLYLAEMPLSTSGKIDRKALLSLPLTRHEEGLVASNETEKLLVEIWSSVLKLDKDQIGITYSFFEMGGHSLSALTLINEILKELDIEISVNEVFTHNTIQTLGELIDNKKWAYTNLGEDILDGDEVIIS